jgi:peptidoglycan/xylan/chitin deacetylase (PgdA/CDA1 family)
MRGGKACLCAALAALLLVCPAMHAAAAADDSVVRVKSEEKLIALTFDDGPHPHYTDRVLAVLSEYGVKATFFEIGVNVERYPEVAKRVAETGHEIGNHTYSHLHLNRVREGDREEEIRRCEEVVREVTGTTPTLFRPPEGTRSESECTLVRACGYRQILWSVDTNDWRGRSAQDITRCVVGHVRGGDIVLMHDYISGKYHSDEALRQLIPRLRERGYRFVTVSELLEAGEAQTPTD